MTKLLQSHSPFMNFSRPRRSLYTLYLSPLVRAQMYKDIIRHNGASRIRIKRTIAVLFFLTKWRLTKKIAPRHQLPRVPQLGQTLVSADQSHPRFSIGKCRVSTEGYYLSRKFRDSRIMCGKDRSSYLYFSKRLEFLLFRKRRFELPKK